MTSAVVSWSTIKFTGNTSSTGTPAAWAAIWAAMPTIVAASDFPWEIASSNNTASDARYICFKRKSGAPGRLVMGFNVNTAAFNPSLMVATPSSASISANSMFFFYIEGATSDVPSNIKGSGTLFTGQDLVNSTYAVYNISPSVNVRPLAFIANEDAIILLAYREDSAPVIPAEIEHMWGAGGLLVNALDVVHNAVISVVSNPATLSSFNQASEGIHHKRTPTGEPELWARAYALTDTALANSLRNNALKLVNFIPVQLASQQSLTQEQRYYYTLRQLAYGPGQLAAREELRDGSGNLKAQCLSGNFSTTSRWHIWTTNFKLNT